MSLPDDLLIHKLRDGESLEGYRIVKVGDRDDPAFADSFRSHYEQGLPPKPDEAAHPVIYMALSLWRTQESAASMARLYPVIGDHIAHVYIVGAAGVDYLDPSLERNPRHLTVWADPATLAEAVADIVPVEGD